MKEFIKLTPYIPNDEGYIQIESPVIIRTNTISTICDDLPRNATRIELISGNVLYVTEKIEKIIEIAKESEER